MNYITALFKRTFCKKCENVHYLCCAIQWPLATDAYWRSEMWLMKMKNWVFNLHLTNLKLKLNIHVGCLAAILDSEDKQATQW